jgi:hypothetical protein
MRDPDGYLIEVGQYSQMALDRFKNDASWIANQLHSDPQPDASTVALTGHKSTKWRSSKLPSARDEDFGVWLAVAVRIRPSRYNQCGRLRRVPLFAPRAASWSSGLRTLISSTVNGNDVSGYFHFQPQGLSGTGETTSDKYQATGVTQQSFKASLQNGQANLTFVNNFRIIGQGPGNNYLVHETMHITINADGTVTMSHDNFSVDCK